MSSKHIFSKGVQISDNFTGTVFVNMLVPDIEGIYNCQAYDVLFEPGCRTYWHKHEGGQLLLCTGGAGYYQEKGKPAQRLAKGDVVEIPPHVAHWHGAAPDNEFNHIGISPNTNKGGCTWLSPVTDEEYKGAVSGK